jgi:hypothetical protein
LPNVIDRIGLGPKREAEQLPSGDWKITVTPPGWVHLPAASIVLTPSQYERYKQWYSGQRLIQDAFPELTRGQREILQTGIDGDTWNKKVRKEGGE